MSWKEKSLVSVNIAKYSRLYSFFDRQEALGLLSAVFLFYIQKDVKVRLNKWFSYYIRAP